MNSIVRLYSNEKHEIKRFLDNFYENKTHKIPDNCEWEKNYNNPIEMVDIIGTFIENKDDYKINMWISLDEGIFINVTTFNADEIIRYLYERYPW